jgi:hypothetical protein
MIKRYYLKKLSFIFFPVIAVWMAACTGGIEDSPNPGVVRIIFQSDPADTTIIILGDTLVATERDFFTATVFQGRVYRDTIFALLFKDTLSYRQEDVIYNLIDMRDGQYAPMFFFGSYAPPGPYNRLQFGLTGNFLRIGSFIIPVQIPPGDELLLDIAVNFEVVENRVTEIYLQLKPLSSLVRFRDTYYFIRDVEVLGVNVI